VFNVNVVLVVAVLVVVVVDDVVGDPDVVPVPSAVVDVLNETAPVPDVIRLAPMEGIGEIPKTIIHI
jgi:hypothetical protein